MDRFTLPNPPILPHRPADGHKGTFGTVGIIGGSAGNPGDLDSLQARMIGAPALVAMGANRSGCGLVKIGAPDSILNAVLSLAPFATGYPIGDDGSAVLDRLASESDALVIGPGLGTTGGTGQLITHAIRSVSQRTKCMVLDADAINALCQLKLVPTAFATPTILTPHPGEAGRLLESLNLAGNPSGDNQQRIDVCRLLASRLGCIVVLKGNGTVVSDGDQHWVCERGHPCLGVGGTGDVLAGMIGSLTAQCVNDPDVGGFASTCIAVEAHARSGELWAMRHSSAGLDPRDLGDLIPETLDAYRCSSKYLRSTR